mmetsp:Transcript_14519/g.19679  ORF Transcript_14519/g.19679 Transcript_14519/m.19679 type:complete len:89 (+) Transcript_14519:33-299(+)
MPINASTGQLLQSSNSVSKFELLPQNEEPKFSNDNYGNRMRDPKIGPLKTRVNSKKNLVIAKENRQPVRLDRASQAPKSTFLPLGKKS